MRMLLSVSTLTRRQSKTQLRDLRLIIIHKNSAKLAQTVNKEFGAIGLENRGVEIGDFLVIRDIKEPAIPIRNGIYQLRS